MAEKNVFNTSVEGDRASVFNTAGNLTIKTGGKSKGKTAYPAGSIGADLIRRNYIRYLVERYNRYKQADASFGKATGKFGYAIIFKNVESKFKAPTYFIPVERFEKLVEYLQGRIDQTILGKRNTAQAQRNYETFDEFRSTQLETGDQASAPR
jgi:hypothetical protein